MEIPYVVTPRKDTGLFNSKIAIWLFLASEVMLFGGFFSAYIFLRLGADYPWPERTLPVLPGLINTFILIASSVTVVFAWASLKMRMWGRFQLFMGITVACALIFMVFKGLEYNVKFHHQAVRLDDYVVLEGHLDKEREGGAHGGHGEDAGHGEGEDNYVKDAHGNKIEANREKVLASGLTFDLVRYHKPWVKDFLAEARVAEAKITLGETINFNAAGESDSSKIFEAGTELSFDLLADLRSEQLENKGSNASWRTKYLREAWKMKHKEVKEDDLLGPGAFAAAYPKGLELGPDERHAAFARWKAGQRSRLAEQVGIDSVKISEVSVPVLIKDLPYSERVLPVFPTASFKIEAPFTLRFKGHDVISKFDPAATQISLRDGTVVSGKMEKSPIVFHNVDGIDFQHLVMKAEEKGLEPLVAIENSWVMKHNPQVAKLWEMHQSSVAQMEARLIEKYGFEKDGETPKRVPTEKDRYRMGWNEIALYTDLIKEGEPLEYPNSNPVMPKAKPTLKEQFTGPDYHTRHFPSISVPREHVMLDAKFTPKWNTYYAIYFTITGLHGLHVIGGAIVLAYYLFRGKQMYLTNPEWLANRVEVGGLFWHFVDLVWIFAFPIFYLM